MDLNNFQFSTDANYMKKSMSGQVNFTLPANGSSSSVTITHNLGYKPQFQYAINLYGTAFYYMNGERVNIRTDSSTLSGMGMSPDVPTTEAYVTNTQLVIRVHNGLDSGQTGTRTLRYIIYLDYKT